jgi:hypothetical protein
MKWSWAVALVVISSAVLLFGQEAMPRPATPPTPVTQVPGRYQLTAVLNSMTQQMESWMIDTQTGDIWAYAFSTGRWMYQGNPTKDPGVRP